MRKRILVTGEGLVGSAIKNLQNLYPYDFYFSSRKGTDLTKEDNVMNLFDCMKPNYVIHTAARVGGVKRNLISPAQQFRDNILINTHMIHYAYKYNVEKMIIFSSTCVFPEDIDVIREDNIHKGPPYRGHWAYAQAKRMIDIQIDSYKQQYGITNYCSVIPGSMFGENDNFDLEDGHVIPSLIHKCYLAKKNSSLLEVWGDGSVTREFVYAQDVARVCLELLYREELPERLIISGEREYSIKEIVDKICNISNFPKDKTKWLLDKPRGQSDRTSDHSIFRRYFPDFKFTDIDIALKNTIEWFSKNYPNIRI